MPASKDPRMYSPEIVALADIAEAGRDIRLQCASSRSATNIRNQFNYYRKALQHEVNRMRDDFRLTKVSDPSYNIKKENYEVERGALEIRLDKLMACSAAAVGSMLIIERRRLHDDVSQQIMQMRNEMTGTLLSEGARMPTPKALPSAPREIPLVKIADIFKVTTSDPHVYIGDDHCIFCEFPKDNPIHIDPPSKPLDHLLPS